ncbi:zinc finger protein 827-like [Anguilla rostrata]|uniref:zinc finger protein 827-like n=1 Tax=Anguilla rostrata TaxID=7938 RepID=UPI0030CCAB43
MPRRKQDQPKRLPSHADGLEVGGAKGPAVEEDGWFGNASDTPSESSYGDEAPLEQDASGESSAGCPTPVPRASLDLLGLDREALRAGHVSGQDTLSSMVSSLFGDASQALGSPMSSNLRRLLEAGELAAQGRGGASPNAPLALSPSSNHAQQQLSALARKLAGSAHSATPSPVSVKLEPGGRFSPTADANGGPAWAGSLEAWPPGGCHAPTSLSPDSAILKLKAAANAVLQDKGAAMALSSSSSSSSSSCSSSVSSMATEEAGRFDAFASPFRTQSASSTLAALSKKVSERSQSGAQPEGAQGTFLSLVSMTSSAALLKEVAARAAGCLLSDKKEPPLVLGPREDVKPPTDKNQNQNQTLDLLQSAPTTPKGKTKASSQGGSPDDGGKPFQCPVCGLVIKRKSYWKRHMVIHTGVKSHQCPLCPFRCARKDNLKSHMKVHQHQDRGETFHCEQCPFTSSRHFSLKLHMRCHQQCPGKEARVKDEVTSDTEDEGGALSLGASGGRGSPLEPDAARLLASPEEAPNHAHVKEEPLEQEVSALSPFALHRERPASVAGSPVPPAASLFSPNMSAKTATDLLIKLSAANQKEALKGPVCVKEEPQAEGTARPAHGAQRPREAVGGKSGLLCQDIGSKVASELLMKLSENKKEGSFQQVTVKAEPMEVDPPQEPPPAPSRVLGFGTLPGSEKADPLPGFPDALGSPQRALFCEDISVKMASELLFKLSERVSKTKNHKDSSMLVTSSSYSDDRFGQTPSDSISKACSSSGAMLHDSGHSEADGGGRTAPWRRQEQLHPCGVCGKVFGSQQTLTRHLSVHTEEKYRCPLCPYAAKCRTSLKRHLVIHSAELGNANADDDITAANTEKSQHSNCPYYYSCLMCGFQTERNAQFVSHMSLHMDREQWMFSLCCTACDFVCGDEVEMKAHANAGGHAGPPPRSPLSETKSPSSSLSTLSDSVNSSEPGEPAAPPSSASSQSSSGSLSGSGAKERPEKGGGAEGFECVFCTFACEAKSVYERHLQAHLVSRMFECDVCHKFLKTPEQLLEHKKCHTAPSGGLKCPLCAYSTSQPAALDGHLKTHCESRFRCRICQAAESSQAALDRHVRGHRLGGHYRCEQCGYASKTANKLIEHVRVHTGERPYRCDRCGYCCRRKDNLSLHKRLKHGQQPLRCPHCAFSSANPCVFSRHARKHRGGAGGGGGGRAAFGGWELKGGGGAVFGGRDCESGGGACSPLLSMSASLALQSVALSVTSRQQGSSSPLASLLYPAPNGRSLPSLSPFPSLSSQYERYRTCDPAHLIPLTTLFGSARFGRGEAFHALSPPPFPRPRPAGSPATPSRSPTSLKHSFLAYLGLTKKVQTV